ncbi:hypothetical protein C0992_008445, partial [Termitomyces sp. T32_za158]
YLVPKFHLMAHIQKCQVDYSFNFTPHVGQTDGEAPERGWAAVNAVSNSTKEMGPGSRHDTLDDHFGDYNWRKIMTLSSTFVRKVHQAIFQREEHVIAFQEFDAALPEEDVSSWTAMVHAWERDPTHAINPFEATTLSSLPWLISSTLELMQSTEITENAVRLELALEDEARLREDLTVDIHTIVHDDVPPGRLIAQGLELEDH